jgi:hypothetical protein
MHKHKELFTSLKELEIRAAQGQNLQKMQNEMINAVNLTKLSSSLLDLDQKAFTVLQHFTEKSKWFESVANRFSIVKSQLATTEKTIIKELKAFEATFEESSRLVSKLSHSSDSKMTEKVKEVLLSLISHDTLDRALKKQFVPIRLLKCFYIDFGAEEPELEVHSELENRKIVQHLAFLVKSIERVAGELIRVIKDSDEEQYQTIQFDRTYTPTSVTPSELKVLKLKINRLHNRGSLTDEEALNMLGKVSIIPISPENNISETLFKKHEIFTDFDQDFDSFPENQKSVFGESFSKELNKRTKPVKRLSKRSSTPAKKIVRNTSLPKAILYNKISSKEKSKQVKLKSKSPHSFV